MKTKKSNVTVASNIWICADDPTGDGNNVYAASKVMPGDLAFECLVPHTDSRIIEQCLMNGTITKKQHLERNFLRHYAPHNHLHSPKVTNPNPV
jgi:hypothetical protein